MNVIFCPDIPALRNLSPQSTNLLVKNNFRLLKLALALNYQNCEFSITKFKVQQVTITNVTLKHL